MNFGPPDDGEQVATVASRPEADMPLSLACNGTRMELGDRLLDVGVANVFGLVVARFSGAA